jgi:DNA mismatch repair protein MSH4
VLNERLDAMEELVRSEAALRAVQSLLPRLLDLDSLLSSFAARPLARSLASCRAAIAAVIGLKTTLVLLPQLSSALHGAANPLLRAIRAHLSAPVLDRVRARIDECLTEDTEHSKSLLQRMHHEAYAVREGLDGNLDVSRAEERGGEGHTCRALSGGSARSRRQVGRIDSWRSPSHLLAPSFSLAFLTQRPRRPPS